MPKILTSTDGADSGAYLQDILAESHMQADEGFDDSASQDSYVDQEVIGGGKYSFKALTLRHSFRISFVSSLGSSIFNYKYENGRRYHAFREGAYLVPNDDEEQNRMDLVHHIYGLLLGGKLHFAPLGNNIHRVLDLGTGTGIWAMDFAEMHPSAEVLGTDLSPIQSLWTPPNCVFEVDDFESEWTYSRKFDFIIGRELEGCIADDTCLFQSAFTHLNPGGYFEMQAVFPQFASDDNTAKEAVDAHTWMNLMCESAASFGKPWDLSGRWKKKMTTTGFVDVQQAILKLPIGGWPKDPKHKEIGKCQQFQELQVLDSYTPGLLSRVLGWTQTEIQAFLVKVRANIKDPAFHLYLPVYFVWGRKP